MMRMRTDPFRELDRLTQQVFGTAARPAAMSMDAFRDGDTFVVELDLPGVSPESTELDVERNVLTVRAERRRGQRGRGRGAAFAASPFLSDELHAVSASAAHSVMEVAAFRK